MSTVSILDANKPIGQRIREARELREMNQSDLAELIGRTQGLVSQIEAGNIYPSFATLDAICNALGMSLSFSPLPAAKSRQKK